MNGIPRLTYQQYRAVRRLVHDCCNYDGGNCLALDDGWEPCVCVQSITYSLVCKWFRAAVLPTDKGLCAALLHRGQARPCAECGAMFVPRSNRGKYCDECAANVRRRKKAASERERRRRGHIRTHNTDLKNRLTKYSRQYPTVCKLTDDDPEIGYKEFEIEKGRFSFRLTAPYSEERRRKASENAKQNGINSQTE